MPHIIVALWMEGVVSWVDHIQAIHSQHTILRSMKLLWQVRKKTSDEWKWMFARWKGWLFIQLYESICVGTPGNSIGSFEIPMGTFTIPHKMLLYNQLNFFSFQGWSSKGIWNWWLVPLALLRKEEVGVGFPPHASWSLSQLSLKSGLESVFILHRI